HARRRLQERPGLTPDPRLPRNHPRRPEKPETALIRPVVQTRGTVATREHLIPMAFPLWLHGWTGTALVGCYVPGDGMWNGHPGQLPVTPHPWMRTEGRAESACCAGESLSLLLSVSRRARPGACGERARGVSASALRAVAPWLLFAPGRGRP